MHKNNPVLHSLGHAILLFLYVSGVAWVMRNGEALFGKAEDTMWAPVIFLMVFVMSAAITATLVLGRPILLYWDNKKKEALQFFGCTLGWIFILIFLLLVIQPWN